MIRLVNTDTSQIIREISRKLDSILLPVSDAHNLTIMKLKVLLEIYKRKICTISDMGNCLGVAGGNISNLCKALEADGYLCRNRLKEDERIVQISLTSRGKSLMTRITNQLSKRYNNYDESIDEEEKVTIINGLQALNKHLDMIIALDKE